MDPERTDLSEIDPKAQLEDRPWEVRAEEARQERAARARVRKAANEVFLQECADAGVRFYHVTPLTEKEKRVWESEKGLGLFLNVANAVRTKDEYKEMMGIFTKRHPLAFRLLLTHGFTGTFAYKQTDDYTIVAVAQVGNGDTFCRRTGRNHAGGRILDFIKTELETGKLPKRSAVHFFDHHSTIEQVSRIPLHTRFGIALSASRKNWSQKQAQ